MQTTANYGLKKPEGNDIVDIDVINENMDTIDGEVKRLSSAIPSVNGKTGNITLSASDIGVGDLSNNFKSNPKNVENVLSELFTFGTNGKNDIYSAISAKGTTPTSKDFSALVTAINNIRTGYSAGDTITDSNLTIVHAFGSEIWHYPMNDLQVTNIVADSSGNIYATIRGYGISLVKLDCNGQLLWSKNFSTVGNDVTVDSSGNVYVACGTNGGGGVYKLDSSGQQMWYSPFPNANRIVIDSSRNVYVATSYSSGGLICKLDSNGKLLWTLSDICAATDIDVDNNGNLYIALSGSGIKKIDSNKQQIWYNTDYLDSSAIAVDNNGNVYVACNINPSIEKLDSNGHIVWKNLESVGANGLFLDSSGNIYIAYNSALSKINSSGQTICLAANCLGAFKITVDSSGNMFVGSTTTGIKKLYSENIYTIKL